MDHPSPEISSSNCPIRKVWVVRYALARIYWELITAPILGLLTVAERIFGTSLSISSFAITSCFIFAVLVMFLGLNAVIRRRRFSFHVFPDGLYYSESFVSTASTTIPFSDFLGAEISHGLVERLLGAYDVVLELPRVGIHASKGIDNILNISSGKYLIIPGQSLECAALLANTLSEYISLSRRRAQLPFHTPAAE